MHDMLSKQEKDVLNFLLLFLISFLGCKLTNGWFVRLLVAIGCWANIYGKGIVTITCC